MKTVNWITPNGNGFCGICGEREQEHEAMSDRCPNPAASYIGQPFYLRTTFTPQVPKGRAKFKPAHFGQRTR